MNIFNQTECPIIEEARLLVMAHFKDSDFLFRVAAVKGFNYTSENGLAISNKILSFKGEIYLRQYRPWNPWSRAIAYAELPNIYFNSRKQMSGMDRVETIVHESMHLMGYSHMGNYVTRYNLGTVPYKVSQMFRRYCEEIYG